MPVTKGQAFSEYAGSKAKAASQDQDKEEATPEAASGAATRGKKPGKGGSAAKSSV